MSTNSLVGDERHAESSKHGPTLNQSQFNPTASSSSSLLPLLNPSPRHNVSNHQADRIDNEGQNTKPLPRQTTLPLTSGASIPTCTIVFSSPVNEQATTPSGPPEPVPQPDTAYRCEFKAVKPRRKAVTSSPSTDSRSYLSPTGQRLAGGLKQKFKRTGAHRFTSSCRSLGPDESEGTDQTIKRPGPKTLHKEFYYGSSVTFCNQKNFGDLGFEFSQLNYDNGILRRSCSMTSVYPTTENLLAAGHTVDPGSTTSSGLGRAKSPLFRRRDQRMTYAGPHPGFLLSPPSITYDVSSTAPPSPCWGRRGEGFGSTYQLQGRNKSVMVTPRGSFLAINQSPIELRESTLSINYPNYAEDGDEVSLVYTRLEKIPMKDFAAEIRAHMDVEQFLSQAQLMLDLHETDIVQIIDRMLHHLLRNEENSAAFQDVMKAIFTDHSAHLLSKTLQCTSCTYGGGFDYDQSWICVLCTVSSVQKRHVAIARLRNPANLGRTSQEVWFILLIVTSTKEKGTKNALETGRTFATLFADMDLRVRLLGARSEDEFKQCMWEHMKELAEEQCDDHIKRKSSTESEQKIDEPTDNIHGTECGFAKGLRSDARRRLKYYASDYTDGFCGQNTLHKTISTTFFLYFACILPAIALGVLNYNNTGEKIDVRKTIYSQTIGGLFFAMFGGQPMVILLTTAPLALYTKVIHTICVEWRVDFLAMYSCTGIWNSLFLLIYAFTDASKLMKWCTRSTEEIFALFISIAFAVDAFKDTLQDFRTNYYSANCMGSGVAGNYSGSSRGLKEGSPLGYSPQGTVVSAALVQSGAQSHLEGDGECLRENSLLYLLLMLGTVWLGLSLYNFTKTPFLNASKRELLADCALPVSVIFMSFFGSYVFRDVKLTQFQLIEGNVFNPAPLHVLGLPEVLGAMGLGFCLSILFFMDQNIAEAMVSSPDNRMKKGSAYHWDLMIVALLNAFLAFFGMPMIHGALPHSPLHVRAMADKEDRVYQGHVYLKIVSVRETRVTGILSHILIGLSIQFIDTLQLIPRPVLDGLFLYLAVTALHSNQLFERIMLLVTEQAAYPPNHYIRTVPQRKVHLFTFLQLLQLAMLCGFGFAPLSYIKMVFPVLHFVMLPIRHKLVPKLIEKRYLQSLDGH